MNETSPLTVENDWDPSDCDNSDEKCGRDTGSNTEWIVDYQRLESKSWTFISCG